MRAPAGLQTSLLGLTMPTRVGLGCGLDPRLAAVDACARFGVGFIEVGPFAWTARPSASLSLDRDGDGLVLADPPESIGPRPSDGRDPSTVRRGRARVRAPRSHRTPCRHQRRARLRTTGCRPRPARRGLHDRGTGRLGRRSGLERRARGHPAGCGAPAAGAARRPRRPRRRDPRRRLRARLAVQRGDRGRRAQTARRATARRGRPQRGDRHRPGPALPARPVARDCRRRRRPRTAARARSLRRRRRPGRHRQRPGVRRARPAETHQRRTFAMSSTSSGRRQARARPGRSRGRRR